MTEEADVQTVDAETQQPSEQEQGEQGQVDDAQPNEDGSEQQPEAEQQAEQKKRGAQKRFDELTRQRHEAERRAQAAENRLREIEAQQTAKQLQEPVLEEYDSIDDYKKDFAEYVKANALETAKREISQRQQYEQIASKQAKVDVAEAEYMKSNPTYAQNAANVTQLMGGNLAPQVAEAFLDLGADAPAVIDALGADLDQLMDFANATPYQQLMKLGELRMQAKSKPKTQRKPLPTPVTPVGANGSASRDPSKMTDAEWLEWRNKQTKKVK